MSLREAVETHGVVQFGERSREESETILQSLSRAPFTNVYLVDGREMLPPEDVYFDVSEVVLELPTEVALRRSVWGVVRPWVNSSGYDLEEDIGQRFLFIRIK